jgi:hypothetical protein
MAMVSEEARKAAERLREAHRRAEDTDTDAEGNPVIVEFCQECDDDWPCDASYVTGAVLDLTAEIRRLQRILLIDVAGATACLTGEPITSNPYKQPGEDWHLWRAGWERVEYKALATEMACYIDATKEIVYRVTLESDDKPSSPEIAQANRLLARWDAMRDGRAYLIDNRIGPNFGKPIMDNYVGPEDGRPTLPVCQECDQSIHLDERMVSNDNGDWHADCANAPR